MSVFRHPLRSGAGGGEIAAMSARVLAAAILAGLALLPACGKREEPPVPSAPAPPAASGYVCPMGCEKDKAYPAPGKCPVCGMDLGPKK